MKHILKIFTFISLLISSPGCKTENYFPKSTGEHTVGTCSYHWANTKEQRELMVQFWYPAQETGQITQKYPAAKTLKMNAREEKIPEDELVEIDAIHTNAFLDADIYPTQEKYPVVIFSHGFGTSRTFNSAMCENLASHGYIVIGIDHPHSSKIIRYPDGRTLKTTVETFKEKVALIKDNVKDSIFVLDKVEEINKTKTEKFYTKLDVNRIGMLGHSVGGIAAAHTCGIDARCKAGINMVGPILESCKPRPFDKPFMFLLGNEETKIFKNPITEEVIGELGLTKQTADDHGFNETYRTAYNIGIPELLQSIHHDTYKITFKGLDHMDFCDFMWLKHFPLFQKHNVNFLSNALDGYKSTHIANDYIIYFFDTYLKEETCVFPEYPDDVTVEKNVVVSREKA